MLLDNGQRKRGRGSYRRQTIPNGIYNNVSNGSDGGILGGVQGNMRRNSLPPVPLQCSRCPSKFNGMGNLGIHEKQHGKFDLRLRCPYCDYCSNRDDYMRNHIQVHAEDTQVDQTQTHTGEVTSGPPEQEQNGEQNNKEFTPPTSEIVTTAEPFPSPQGPKARRTSRSVSTAGTFLADYVKFD